LNEAVHAARDRFTQPFAYRHSYKEVAGWFVSNEYSGLKLLKDENLPNGVPETYSLNIGIRGFKN